MMQILPYGSYSDPYSNYYAFSSQQFNPSVYVQYNPALAQCPYNVIQGAIPDYQYVSLRNQIPPVPLVPNYIANVAAFPVSSGARVYPTPSFYQASSVYGRQPGIGWRRI